MDDGATDIKVSVFNGADKFFPLITVGQTVEITNI